MTGVVLILDCNDLDRTATFWAGALRYQEVYRSEPYLVLMPADQDGDGSGLVLQLQRVPEPKQGKNRLHLDIHVDELEPEVERLVGLGARPADTDIAQESGFRWQVMADPEGNEFCVCAACAEDRTRRSTRRCDEAVVEGEHDGGGAVAQIELREDVADVALHGRLAHKELLGDLGVARPATHHAEHIELAPRELLDPGGGRVVVGGRGRPVSREDPSGHGRVEPGPALGHHPGRAHDLLAGRVLELETRRAGAQRGREHLVVVEGRQHEDGGSVVTGAEALGGLGTVDALHAHVHHDDVGTKPPDCLLHLVAVLALAHDLESLVGVEDAAQPGTDQLLVVDEQNPDQRQQRWRRGASGRGSVASTSQPSPWGRASSEPPRATARSRIPRKPRPPFSDGTDTGRPSWSDTTR